MKKINISKLIGMTGVFKDDGYFYVIDNLKVYRIIPHQLTEFMMIVGFKGRNAILSYRGIWDSLFPIKYIKLIKQNEATTKGK